MGLEATAGESPPGRQGLSVYLSNVLASGCVFSRRGKVKRDTFCKRYVSSEGVMKLGM